MKLTAAIRRKFRVRNKLKKISKGDRLRLSISRSTKNISAQIIDDKSHATILSASSNEKEMRSMKKNKTDICVIGGCGHVGLPLALCFADKGLEVSVYDINEESVKIVNDGVMPFLENGCEKL